MSPCGLIYYVSYNQGGFRKSRTDLLGFSTGGGVIRNENGLGMEPTIRAQTDTGCAQKSYK